MDKLAPAERHKYQHDGRTIYEWDQTFSEVNIYVEVPLGIKAKDLACTISVKHISLGLKGNPPYLDHELVGSSKVNIFPRVCLHIAQRMYFSSN
jgi:hypothetical protein